MCVLRAVCCVLCAMCCVCAVCLDALMPLSLCVIVCVYMCNVYGYIYIVGIYEYVSTVCEYCM